MWRILVSFLLLSYVSVIKAAKSKNVEYSPDWPSLDSRPLPDWFDEAKVGIFMHFGVYSVQAFSDAWFWYNWKNGDPATVNFMKDNYPPNFTYQDFAPQLTMEFFNASLFADIIAGSGAKYLVFTSKHHDGFLNWPSSYSFGWNSMDLGPRKNVLKELKQALSRTDVRFGVYYCLYEWFHPLYLQDKANNFTTRDFVLNKMLPEMKELINTFEPHVLWSDGDWEAYPEYFGSKDFLAWLYNQSPVKDVVVTNDRWGIGCAQTHGGFWSGPDRWFPGHLIEHKWENAMTVDRKSWGNRKNLMLEDILTSEELIRLISSTVSCGGNILINVGPTKEGTIIPIFQERLHQMGSWLKLNGEAIYKTTPWSVQNDSLSVQNEVWYTAGKGSLLGTVYALVIGWPKNDVVVLGSVQAHPGLTTIELIGLEKSLKYKQTESGLLVRFPNLSKVREVNGPSCEWATALRMKQVEPRNRAQNGVTIETF